MRYVKDALLLVLTALCVWAGLNAPSWYRSLSRDEETAETVPASVVELRLKEKEQQQETAPEVIWTEIRGSAAGEVAAIASAESFLNDLDSYGAGMISMPLKKAMKNGRAFLRREGDAYSLFWQVTVEIPNAGERAEIWTSEEGWILCYTFTGPGAPVASDGPADPAELLPGLDGFAHAFAEASGRWPGEIVKSSVDTDKAGQLEYAASFTDTDAVLLIRILRDGAGIDARWSDARVPGSAFEENAGP